MIQLPELKNYSEPEIVTKEEQRLFYKVDFMKFLNKKSANRTAEKHHSEVIICPDEFITVHYVNNKAYLDYDEAEIYCVNLKKKLRKWIDEIARENGFNLETLHYSDELLWLMKNYTLEEIRSFNYPLMFTGVRSNSVLSEVIWFSFIEVYSHHYKWINYREWQWSWYDPKTLDHCGVPAHLKANTPERSEWIDENDRFSDKKAILIDFIVQYLLKIVVQKLNAVDDPDKVRIDQADIEPLDRQLNNIYKLIDRNENGRDFGIGRIKGYVHYWDELNPNVLNPYS